MNKWSPRFDIREETTIFYIFIKLFYIFIKNALCTLREEILAGRKFGGFGGFCPKPPN